MPVISANRFALLTANTATSADNRTTMLKETCTVPQALRTIEGFLLFLEASLAYRNFGYVPWAFLRKLVVLGGVDDETVERKAEDGKEEGDESAVHCDYWKNCSVSKSRRMCEKCEASYHFCTVVPSTYRCRDINCLEGAVKRGHLLGTNFM